MKHKIAWLMALCLCLLACVPTPDEPIVVGKDQTEMLEKASATDVPETSSEPAATHIKEAFTEHGVSVTIDANVTMPDGEIPIVRVHAVDFSQETVDRLWSVLIGDTVMYDGFRVAEKHVPEIGSTLTVRDDGVTVLNAIEKPTGKWWETDGKYFSVLNNRKTPYGKGKPLTFDATLDYRYTHANEEFYEDVLERDLKPIIDMAETPDHVKLSMPPVEAMRQAADWIERLGLPFKPLRVTAVQNEAEQDAYLVECARVVNGIPVVIMDAYSRFDPKSSVAVDWYYESFKLLLNDSGLLAMRWESPIEMDDTVVETALLLPFADVMEVFRKMMPIRYASSFEGRTETFHIDTIRLESVRVMEQNAENAGLLIPAWCFYGTYRTEAENWVDVETYGCRLIINAVDGSLIDPQQGY